MELMRGAKRASRRVATQHGRLGRRVDEDAIRNYVGDIERVVSGRGHRKTFLVTVPASPAIDPLLPISDHPNAGIFHARQQVWVHVAYRPYRPAYKRALQHDTIDGLILSHAMNRDTAAHKGFGFVRLTPVSGVANVSSAFSELSQDGLLEAMETMRTRGRLFDCCHLSRSTHFSRAPLRSALEISFPPE